MRPTLDTLQICTIAFAAATDRSVARHRPARPIQVNAMQPQPTNTNRSVLVYGAYGHTGRFIISELLEKGFSPVLSGRDRTRLEVLGAAHPRVDVRAASLDDRAALEHAFEGVAAVINAAGPFAFTASRLINAAIRARVPYLDVAAEPDVVAATIESHGDRSLREGIAVIPAAAFYGGLGDLLATAAMADWPDADEITLAYPLSRWKPTAGRAGPRESA